MQKITIVCSNQDEAQEYWYSHKLISEKYSEVEFLRLPKTVILKPKHLNIFVGISYRDLTKIDILRIEKEHSLVITKNFNSVEVKKLNYAGWSKILDIQKKLFLKVLEGHFEKLQNLPTVLTINRVSKQVGLTEKERRMLELILDHNEVSKDRLKQLMELQSRSFNQHSLSLQRKLASIGISLSDKQNGQFYRIS